MSTELPIALGRHGAQTVRMSSVMRSVATPLWQRFGIAALVSLVTMPLTAMWFLLAGGALLVAGLLPPALGRSSTAGTMAFVGLGLLVGPAIYISLALAQ